MAHLRGQDKVAYIYALFSRIPGRYDFMNTVISGGMHYSWRRLAAKLTMQTPIPQESKALDIATGTGDFAFDLLRRGAPYVVGMDFVRGMLVLADRKAGKQRKQDKVTWVEGDALQLPFPSNSFRWVTVGFNTRNVADLPLAISEMTRVATPGGRVVILDITPLPKKGLFPTLFRFYFGRITPIFGQLLAGDRAAYTYLPSSVERFPPAATLAGLMQDAGLRNVHYKLVGFRSTAIHIGDKPQEP